MLQSVSELCVRCGLCCCALNATVPRNEAQKLADWGKIPSESLFLEYKTNDPSKPDDNNLVQLRFPCRFLRGRPVRGVSCAAYKGPRPELCQEYLCRVATQYKLGELELEVAISHLIKAYWTNDVGIFNWCGKPGETKLQIRAALKEEDERLRKDGHSDLERRFLLAMRITPHFAFASAADYDIFCMHLNTFDECLHKAIEADDTVKGDILKEALPVYFEPDVISRMTSLEQRFAGWVIAEVLMSIRKLFKIEVRINSGISKAEEE